MFLGLSSAIADVHVFKRSVRPMNVGLVLLGGYAFGSYIADNTTLRSIAWRNWDGEILTHFD